MPWLCKSALSKTFRQLKDRGAVNRWPRFTNSKSMQRSRFMALALSNNRLLRNNLCSRILCLSRNNNISVSSWVRLQLHNLLHRLPTSLHLSIIRKVKFKCCRFTLPTDQKKLSVKMLLVLLGLLRHILNQGIRLNPKCLSQFPSLRMAPKTWKPRKIIVY